ncbi:MAG TPA: ABC transporter ATP-binding protein [Thermodesulfobacteriota bacterium]|nr:ABC transporter ATP-binding protein [Thermodesulfobacteriota bacterium]
MSFLSLDQVEVRYGDAIALFGISLEVLEGEVVSIVGANGAGKSTTIKTISGLLKPRKGQVLFQGKRLNEVAAHSIVDLGIIQIPEGRQLFPYMTTLENLELGSYTHEARKKVSESLQRVFDLFPLLRERKDQLAGTLSGGEQQMLAIGRGLMALPKLLTLDEPSLGLAPIMVKTIFEAISKINQAGTTILLVEQDVKKSLSLARRGYVMENGKITLQGEAQELLKNEHLKRAYLGI